MSEVKDAKRKEVIEYFRSKDCVESDSGAKGVTFKTKIEKIKGSEREMARISIMTKSGLNYVADKVIIKDWHAELHSDDTSILVGLDEITQYAVKETMTKSGLVLPK